MGVARKHKQAEPLIACLYEPGTIQFERVQRGEAVIALSEASNLCEQAKNKDAELGKKAAAFYTEMSKSACCGCSGEFAQALITIEDE